MKLYLCILLSLILATTTAAKLSMSKQPEIDADPVFMPTYHVEDSYDPSGIGFLGWILIAFFGTIFLVLCCVCIGVRAAVAV